MGYERKMGRQAQEGTKRHLK